MGFLLILICWLVTTQAVVGKKMGGKKEREKNESQEQLNQCQGSLFYEFQKPFSYFFLAIRILSFL